MITAVYEDPSEKKAHRRWVVIEKAGCRVVMHHFATEEEARAYAPGAPKTPAKGFDIEAYTAKIVAAHTARMEGGEAHV